VAQSAMWVGAELGGNFNSADLSASAGHYSDSNNIAIRPAVIGGATLGYDFINAGFGGRAWPEWMQYFSFATDITYNKLEIHRHFGFLSPGSRLNGYEVAWTFLFMAHYGFLKDSEVPTGRINPYIGVGPAILWTGIEGTLPYHFAAGEKVKSSNFGDSAMNVALIVEPGIRWMCFKNVSVDTAMRYRYAVPSWSGNNASLNLNLHQFAFLLRANYHF
jgi:hypothetical protein